METEIRFVDPLAGSDAEPLWYEGQHSYVDAGFGRNARVSAPPPDLVAWVAYVEGVPAGMQVCRLKPGNQSLYGLLSWVGPAYRALKLFNLIRVKMDADAIQLGYRDIVSEVVDGPEAAGMCAAIEARGGQKTGEIVVSAVGGKVIYHQYRRSLIPLAG